MPAHPSEINGSIPGSARSINVDLHPRFWA
jgi:hypothetical protein